MPDDWAVQVQEAFVNVQKHGLAVDSIVLPWDWREQWSVVAGIDMHDRLFGVPVRFAMVDQPVAIIDQPAIHIELDRSERSDFGCLSFGGTTGSFPKLKR